MEQWRHVRREGGQLPPLLIKASFSDKGYSIRLTDLGCVWVETLDRKAIVAQAQRQECSIDPGEDVKQYSILLEKLQNALDQGDKTSFALSTTSKGDLRLHLTAPLPSPLPALEWEVRLKRAPDEAVADDLVSPLLHRAHNLNHHLETLIAELQAKDRIIAKITDRLETSGHDLTAVFPGVSNVKLSRKKSQQEQLARHVQGLGKFDEDAWKLQILNQRKDGPLSTESTDLVFAALPESANKLNYDGDAAVWWHRVPVGQQIDLGQAAEEADEAERTTVSRQQSPPQKVAASTTQDDDDEFQKQATPPHLRSHPPPPAQPDDTEMGGVDEQVQPDDESTEDEDDLDAPLKSSKPHSKPAIPKAHSNHAVATPKVRSPSPAKEPIARATTTRTPFIEEDDDETDDDDDDDLDRPSQPSQRSTAASRLPSRQKSATPQPTPSKASPRKKLRALGGRISPSPAREKSVTPVNDRNDEPSPSPSPKPNPKPKTKLGTLGGSKPKLQPSPPASSPADSAPAPATKKMGVIGGKRAATPSRAATASATPEPTHIEPAERAPRQREKQSVPAARQTSEERLNAADAKRDALKRELQEKAKAPVKKKRKF